MAYNSPGMWKLLVLEKVATLLESSPNETTTYRIQGGGTPGGAVGLLSEAEKGSSWHKNAILGSKTVILALAVTDQDIRIWALEMLVWPLGPCFLHRANLMAWLLHRPTMNKNT